MLSFGFIVLIFEIFSSSGASYSGAQSEIVSGKVDFLELRHFDKHFVKKSRKKGTAGKNFSVFHPRYSSNYILNEKLNPRKGAIRAFFPKIRASFWFSKKGTGGLPPSLLLVARLIIEEWGFVDPYTQFPAFYQYNQMERILVTLADFAVFIGLVTIVMMIVFINQKKFTYLLTYLFTY